MHIQYVISLSWFSSHDMTKLFDLCNMTTWLLGPCYMATWMLDPCYMATWLLESPTQHCPNAALLLGPPTQHQ